MGGGGAGQVAQFFGSVVEGVQKACKGDLYGRLGSVAELSAMRGNCAECASSHSDVGGFEGCLEERGVLGKLPGVLESLAAAVDRVDQTNALDCSGKKLRKVSEQRQTDVQMS